MVGLVSCSHIDGVTGSVEPVRSSVTVGIGTSPKSSRPRSGV